MSENKSAEMYQVWQQDKDHYIHPWTDFSTFKETGSIVVEDSDNVHITDGDGNQYLDGIGGLWCVNIGYAREEMAQAIAEQIMKVPYYSCFGHHTTVPAAKLAAKIAELAPGNLNHVFYGCGGSVANDTAVRIIHFYFNQLGKKSKKKIISRIDGYHGSTYMAMSITGVKFDHIGFDIDEQLVHHISCPNPYRRPESQSIEDFCDEKVQELENKILELGPDNVAAFFAEPIMGAGGVIVPPKGYHKRTLDVCRKYGVLYVSDEVVTAFGRLGHMFASKDEFDIVPDIITCAKGLTSGYLPLGATILSDDIYEVISKPQAEGALFTHGFTYSGHPVSCAAGLKNIEIMERENLCGHVQEIGSYFEEQLKTLMDLPIVGDVRGKKFMVCVENVANKESKELIDPEAQVGNRIADHCQKRGLIVRPLAHMNILSPPLTLSKDNVDFLVSTLRESIVETMKDLKQDGYL
ncbi:aminotransferase [Marinomonas posidonica]|uniref:Adenosylmethionine--8-amino-7-oxononanoate transaminase n=1 Tax=Marinomonas posidonica (strain CECT 7376 / NCIMB 14433 / IVIA-Po-181) TaxID=491952 RepID=F6CWZ1_MARPP|nr:aminotransferase [Marinomonas posidonica]AEF55553.1 Adenosylmethionine--8-amino-7-oxononanoate transaminase [Marinomonas posidonica IVIA-Po-181]